MNDTQEIFPLIAPPISSDYYVDELTLRAILAKGCVMCQEDFSSRAKILAHYETSNLHIIGLTLIEVAELRLVFHDRHSSFDTDVFVVDKKAAVCLKCWVEFLKQIVKLKGKDDASSS